MFKLASVAAVLSLALGAAAQLTINTPASVVQCQPVQLAFMNGLAPYFISIIPGGQVSAPAIENLGTTSGNTLTWLADIASGTSITFEIRDSEGVTAFTAPVTVQVSSDAACVGKNSLTNTNTATAPGSTVAPPATTPAATTPAATQPGVTTPANTPRPSTTSPSTSTTAKPASGAAPMSKSNVIVALGVAAAALALLG